MQMQKQKISHIEVHITEISQLNHDRKARYASGMTKKGLYFI